MILHLVSMVKDTNEPTVWSNGPRNKYDPDNSLSSGTQTERSYALYNLSNLKNDQNFQKKIMKRNPWSPKVFKAQFINSKISQY